MLVDPATEWAAEIRAWLLGRLAKAPTSGLTPSSHPTQLRHPPILAWWVFEGKRYEGVQGPLRSKFGLIEKMAARLVVSYNPKWRSTEAPEGETDWVASAFSTLTLGQPVYVSRSTGIGLSDPERDALLGWMEWLRLLWHRYTERIGPLPAGHTAQPLWPERRLRFQQDEVRCLRRWAHTARRSRWPLLRIIVAESLRAALEREDLDRLPLPSDRATLFELLCIVRILCCFEPRPTHIRWLDLEAGDNTVALPGLRCRFQHGLPKATVLSTQEFEHGLREALARQSVRVPSVIDGWIEFDPPIGGWGGVLVEAKSGEQEPSAAVYQLKCYRTALRLKTTAPILVLAVTEKPVDRSGLESALAELRHVSQRLEEDFWIFCGPGDISEVLHAARITTTRHDAANPVSSSPRSNTP